MSNMTIENTTTESTKNEAVVQNDTLNFAVSHKMQTLELLNKLVNEREEWETTAYKKSNDMLYAILQKCASINAAMFGNTKDVSERRDALAEFIEQKGYRFTEATPVVTKVVKCVFGVDRRRVSAYSLVLREATRQGVTAFNLPGWIEDNGGVEQIRLGNAGNGKTAKQKTDEAKSVVQNQNAIAVIASEALSEAADSDFAGKNCVLLATQQADGSFSIRAVVRSASALNATLLAYYSEHKDSVQSNIKKQAAANDDTICDEAIEAAAAQ